MTWKVFLFRKLKITPYRLGIIDVDESKYTKLSDSHFLSPLIFQLLSFHQEPIELADYLDLLLTTLTRFFSSHDNSIRKLPYGSEPFVYFCNIFYLRVEIFSHILSIGIGNPYCFIVVYCCCFVFSFSFSPVVNNLQNALICFQHVIAVRPSLNGPNRCIMTFHRMLNNYV